MVELYHWARGSQHPYHTVELGTRSGNSTSCFLAACETMRRGHVWSVDLDHPDVPAGWWDSPYWDFRRGDALSPDTLDWAPGKIDVLFVDLDPHTFEQTFAVLMMWAPRVTPGGVILLHDTEWPEINCVRPGSAESAVGRAIDTYCKLKGLEWHNRPGCNGLGVLRIR